MNILPQNQQAEGTKIFLLQTVNERFNTWQNLGFFKELSAAKAHLSNILKRQKEEGSLDVTANLIIKEESPNETYFEISKSLDIYKISIEDLN